MVTTGETVSHYRILEKLGGGGMGIVFKAEDTRLHRQVALKFLPEEYARDRQALERFHREAYAASALNHPNICVIHDIDEHEGKPFIAMELLEGQTLKERLAAGAHGARPAEEGKRGSPLRVDEVLDLGIQIADALEAAHAKGILHRDIKPANLMISERDQAKILDFGLAKLIHEGTPEASTELSQELSTPKPNTASSGLESLTRAGTTVGTPAYMSPEQVVGQNLDGRTDLFSLGVVLYEMATGRRAFEGPSPKETLENILIHAPAPPSRTNPEWPPAFDEVVRKLLEKDRELRYQTAADVRADLKRLRRDMGSSGYLSAHTGARVSTPGLVQELRRPWFPAGLGAHLRRLSLAARVNLAIALVLILALGAGVLFWQSQRRPKLTEKDSILITDFVNTTGDPVFDHVLKQALTIKLSESPFLNIFPEDRVREALRLMSRSPDERVTPSIGREICARHGIQVMIAGQIAPLGSHYVISLDALNSRSGDALARQQVEAASKERVLEALGQASSKLRAQLGESLSSLGKFDTPIQQATTSSLEAFNAFNLGVEQSVQKGSELEGIPFLKRAVELDPNFAMAYSVLASRYANLSEAETAAEYATKAFQLREHSSEREKFHIAATYYSSVTGNIDKEIETCLLWEQFYPRDSWAHIWLGVTYGEIGQYEKALKEFLEVERLAPNDAYSYFNLGWIYLCLNRYAESKAVYTQAIAKNFDVFTPHERLYLIAFVEGDPEAMQRHAAWATGKPEEYAMLSLQAATEAYFGRLEKARGLWDRAAEMAEHTGLKGNAAAILAYEALIDASCGYLPQARAETARVMALAQTRDVIWPEVEVLAVSGDAAQGEALTRDSSRRFPEDTLINSVYLPFLRAGLELHHGDAVHAVDALQAAVPYERAFWQVFSLRGLAYLKAGKGSEAAAQFQRMMEYKGGLRVNHPWQALAHLYLGRAWAMAGDKQKSRIAYLKFLTLWKDADPNIPILLEARAEYAKLR